MTLVVAADVQDYILLAADHYAELADCRDPSSRIVLDNYRKIYLWKYGALTASGDVLLVSSFFQLFAQQEAKGGGIDLLRIGKLCKASRCAGGAPAEDATANLFFTLPGGDGFELHALSIGDAVIRHEVIAPVGAQFSMLEGAIPAAQCHEFNRQLCPGFMFASQKDFYRYCGEILCAFYRVSAQACPVVTESFDVYLLKKHTGEGVLLGTLPAGKMVSLGAVDESMERLLASSVI